VDGHINQLCARAVAKGIDLFKVLNAACVNPVLHYDLNVGLLREGDAADFIVVKDLKEFEVEKTFINGELVTENGKSKIKSQKSKVINNFSCTEKQPEDFTHLIGSDVDIPVIVAIDGQLITSQTVYIPPQGKGIDVVNADLDFDILKIVVVNRYKNAPVATAFINNFRLLKGAIASSVAHDSHNIVAVGVDDVSICKAVNLIIKKQGGVSAVSDSKEMVLALPVAGLMSNEDGYKIAEAYTAIDRMVKEELGSTLSAPFMTLSFMALLVIPHLKLSDMGLFDGDRFEFV
jgi:adenine deaminase